MHKDWVLPYNKSSKGVLSKSPFLNFKNMKKDNL